MYTKGKSPNSSPVNSGAAGSQAAVQRKSKSKLTSNIQAHLEQNSAIQRKVKIGQANDRYEKEADKVADHVVNSPEPAMVRSVQTKAEGISTLQRAEEEEAQAKIQRQEEEEAAQPMIQKEEEEEAAQPKGEEEEESMQAKGEEEEAQTKIQRQEEEEAQTKREFTAEQSEDFERKLEVSKNSGEKLQGEVKLEMEAKIGADFSNIRVHTGPVADELSKDIGALAFAIGNHVYFKEGQFNPESKEGRHLLAHELTHTVQQGAAGKDEAPAQAAKGISRQTKILEEETEEEAEVSE